MYEVYVFEGNTLYIYRGFTTFYVAQEWATKQNLHEYKIVHEVTNSQTIEVNL